MSGSRTPEVVTGARAPRGEFKEATKSEPGFQTIPEGKRIFQAIAGRYRLQLTAPQAIRLQDGRILDSERPLVVQFADHMITLDTVKDARKIELIEQHQHFGKDFWDLKTRIDAAQAKKLESAVEYALKASPEEREAIRLALEMSQAEDFDLPPKVPQKVEAQA